MRGGGAGVLRCWGAAVLGALAVVTLSSGLAAQQGPDRSKAPLPGPAPALKLPPIQKRTLGNGLPVWVVEMHEVPVANITLVVKAGASVDPAGKYGLASFAAAMLDEGAGTRNALDLADAVEFLGASLSTGSAFDSSSVRLQTPVSKLDDALPLMADVALRPQFNAAELERLRKERLTSLLQTRDNPGALASAAFARVVFGPRHRYGTPAMGNSASNGEMTVADLRGFYTSWYQPQHSHLIVVGDVTAAAVLPKLEKAFGGWKNGATAAKPVIETAAQHGPRQIYLVDKPGAAQSQIRIGWVGVPRSTADYYPLDVLNTVLGGSFTSRLNQNLREKNGYAYGASSGFDMRLSAGPFSARASVQTDKTADALREFFNELNAITNPIPADELDKARNYVALGFPSEFETLGDLSAHLEELIVYKLPDSYFEDYVANIRAVTPAAVQKVAAAHIQPKRFAVVVVGDRKVIEPGIKALNLGPMTVMSVEEAMGS